jgi:hypothetical protein
MNTLYKDGLVEITDQEIVFLRYYCPFASDKHVPWEQIERVEIKQPGFWGGSWRIWGSGDFHTWFPLDGARPNRDRIFIMFLRNRYWRIGFTVEHFKEVTDILNEHGLLREPSIN